MSRLIPISRAFIPLSLLAGLIVALAGCENGSAAISNGEPRIASLSPALTSMAIDLGLGEAIVGRTPYCRGVAAEVPVVGSLDTVDAEMLIRTSPTMLLVQPSAAGLDPALASLASEHGFALVAQRLDGVKDIIHALDAIAVAHGGAAVDAARVEHVLELEAMLAEEDFDAPRIVVLYSVDPLGAVGRATYLDEVLIAAGARNAIAREGWLELAPEELLQLGPDIVVLIGADTSALETLPFKGEVKVLAFDEPDALEPSARAPRVAAKLRQLIGGNKR